MRLQLCALFLCVALAPICVAWASAAVKSGKVHDTCKAEGGKCAAEAAPADKPAADQVLDSIDRLHDSTTEKVLQDNEAPEGDTGDERVLGKKGDAFGNVFNSAYKQWVAGAGTAEQNAKGKAKGLSPAARKAIIEEVQRRKDASANAETADGQKMNESTPHAREETEPVLLENALRRVSEPSPKNMLDDLELIEYLCHSGDNGIHLESVGGVGVLLRLTRGKSADDAKVWAVKALATCAQNNPAVFNRALADGAVSTMLTLADGGATAEMRASALRALVSLREGDGAMKAFLEEQEGLLRVVESVLKSGVLGRNERRGVLRGLAIVEPLVKNAAAEWRAPVEKTGILKWCRDAISHDDIDVKEAAALVVKAADAR